MLRNTLILPESDARLAAQLLRDAVESLEVVLMLVLGKSPEIGQIVNWADQLCNKTQTADGNLRKVVWIRDPTKPAIRSELERLLGEGELPRVAVLNFYDQPKARLTQDEPIDPLILERAFLEGHK